MLQLVDCPSPLLPPPYSSPSSRDQLPCNHDDVLNMSPTPSHHSSMELMKDIDNLENEIMRLERYLLSLYRAAFQQSYSKVELDMSNCVVGQYDRVSTSSSLGGSSDQIRTAKKSSSRRVVHLTPGHLHIANISVLHLYVVSDIFMFSVVSSQGINGMTKSVFDEQLQGKIADSGHCSLADHLSFSRMDDILSCPARLSEEIVRCISCIYYKFSNPERLTQKGLSVSSTSSSSKFSPTLSGSWSPNHDEGSTELYEFEVCNDDNRPYSTMLEIQKISLHEDSFNYATTMLQKFRSLVKSLEKVDPRNMNREEKLTFWINIHNALVMHAYLAYGTQSSVRSSSILKAAYNVGGLCVNAYVIQSSILGIQPHYSAPWLQTLFSPGKNLATGNSKHAYAIEYPEPLVHFALCLGASSDPALQVYMAKTVFRDLKAAKDEFIQATVCINKDTRIYLPKIICYFAKDMSLDMAGVFETVMGSLPETQRKLVRSCMKGRPDKLIYWLPQSCTFRYLIPKQVIQGRLPI